MTVDRHDKRNSDQIDVLRGQWNRELPDLDTSPMAILGRIRRIAILVSPAIEGALAAHGLDRGEFDVLASLRRSGAPYRLAPTDLYKLLMVPSGSLTHRLDRLHSRGLVAREPLPTDRRSKLVRLTEKGKQTVEDAFRDDMAVEAEFLRSLDSTEHDALADGLRALLRLVEDSLAIPEAHPPGPMSATPP